MRDVVELEHLTRRIEVKPQPGDVTQPWALAGLSHASRWIPNIDSTKKLWLGCTEASQ